MLHKAIPDPLASFLGELKNLLLPEGTYLAGGTAVALYLGHRVSVDIDLFTEKEFYCGPLISEIGQKYTIEVTNPAEKNNLAANVDGIKFSLFSYPYPLLEPFNLNPDFKINMASLMDIAAMKVIAIAQRGAAKDFVDLKAIITNNHISLDYLVSLVHRKYKVSEDYGYQLKKSLVYFEDAQKSLGDVMVIKAGKPIRMSQFEWGKVEEFFKRFVLL